MAIDGDQPPGALGVGFEPGEDVAQGAWVEVGEVDDRPRATVGVGEVREGFEEATAEVEQAAVVVGCR